MQDETDAKANKVGPTVERIKPHLAGLDPDVQGAILADLTAILLAGHPDFMREDLLAAHVDGIRALIPVNEAIMFGDVGHPQNEGAAS